MQRIPQIDPAKATTSVVATLEAVRARLGMLPNLFSTMAQAPAILDGYLRFSGAIGTGKLSPRLREQIALVTAGANCCDYCASAHATLGQLAGLTPSEIKLNLSGLASDPVTQVALAFARVIVLDRGVVSNAEFATIKTAGYSDEDAIEILGNACINIFTCYFNHLAATDIDFPLVRTGAPNTAH